ncbi:hypothetical protein PN498_13340 [Oscillatoria sp. CS-180]|uniref:hypothetical protein n=1 Tax=Oscillatoria sp. CS-180 TaxID=3021720 RepID=UPI0023311C45|nr:hypothetical protein [Oscillatoria sp. CS-180]MDB9526978.1 hypothetical protein [Oscillatoria sp. CS-180]
MIADLSLNDVSTLLMALFTCVITVANILLWLATRRTIKLQVISNYSLNHQSIVNGHRDLFLGLLHQPGIFKQFAIANKLDPEKWELQIISSFFINHAFIHYLNFTNGTLDKAYLEGFKRDAQELLALPTIQTHWQAARLGYSAAFRTFVEEELMPTVSDTSISTSPPSPAKS